MQKKQRQINECRYTKANNAKAIKAVACSLTAESEVRRRMRKRPNLGIQKDRPVQSCRNKYVPGYSKYREYG